MTYKKLLHIERDPSLQTDRTQKTKPLGAFWRGVGGNFRSIFIIETDNNTELNGRCYLGITYYYNKSDVYLKYSENRKPVGHL